MPKDFVKKPSKPQSTVKNLTGRPNISLKERAEQYKSHGIIAENKCLICAFCGDVLANNKFQIDQHLKTIKHRDHVSLKEKQTTLPGLKCQNAFARDICEAFVGSDIPLKKLSNPVLKRFLQSYTGRRIPDESTIRKSFLEVSYNETIERIREDIGEDCIWFSVDETTDVEGRYIADVIVGALRPDRASTPYLLHTVHLEKTNSQTIARTVNEAFQILWPSGINYDRVLLFVSDAAAYMLKAGKDLLIFYSRMIHVTCLAHALHRVSDCIRDNFKKADSLISNVKKVFLKAPSRTVLLKSMFPDLKLPPVPVITRWGTWIAANAYYAENWSSIKAVVDALPSDDAVAIGKAKELFNNSQVFEEVKYVYENYNFIPSTIQKLEMDGKSVKDVLAIVSHVLQKIGATSNIKIKNKLSEVLQKNPGLKAINALQSNNATKLSEIPQFQEMSPAELAKYMYAPLVSCEVERSFSRYKRILSNNRRRFIFPHLRYYLVVECNAFKFSKEENEEHHNSCNEEELYAAYN